MHGRVLVRLQRACVADWRADADAALAKLDLVGRAVTPGRVLHEQIPTAAVREHDLAAVVATTDVLGREALRRTSSANYDLDVLHARDRTSVLGVRRAFRRGELQDDRHRLTDAHIVRRPRDDVGVQLRGGRGRRNRGADQRDQEQQQTDPVNEHGV
jgi:hypothetical protein